MAWIKFTERFKWSPPERHNTLTIVYKPGVYNVTTPCAKAAIAAGKGVRVPAARRGDEADGVQG
jgi:hypothetical protein